MSYSSCQTWQTGPLRLASDRVDGKAHREPRHAEMTQGPDIETRPAEPAEPKAREPSESGRPGDGGSWRRAPEASTAPGGYASSSEGDVDEISFLELVNVILKRRKLVVGLPLVVAFLTAIVSLVLPAKYTAGTSFISESESPGLGAPSGLAGIASQFGFAIPGSGASSPAFYADVLRSRTLRDQILLASFADPRGVKPGDSVPLLDILEIESDDERLRLEKGRKYLSGIVKVDVDNETDIVGLSVKTRHAALSADVANLFVELLNSFNLETRQSNAHQRRSFIETRVDEAGRELLAVEEKLKAFLESNRQFQGSPELQFQHDRLQRQVSLKQEVLSTLNREYEEARIEEVNDTPVITVVDRAVAPVQRSSPKRKLNVMIALILGGVLGLFGAFGAEFFERAQKSDKEQADEFSARWSAVKKDVRSFPSRMFRSKRS